MNSTSHYSIHALLGRVAATGAVIAVMMGGGAAHAEQAPMIFNGQALTTQPIREADLRPPLDELHDAELANDQGQRIQSPEFPEKLVTARAAVRMFGQSLKANHEEDVFRLYSLDRARSNGQTALLAYLQQPGSVATLLTDAEQGFQAEARKGHLSASLKGPHPFSASGLKSAF